MSNTELAMFVMCWYGLGLVGSVLVMFETWYGGGDIDEADVMIGFLLALLGPIMLAIGLAIPLVAMCALILEYVPKFCIKGRKSNSKTAED